MKARIKRNEHSTLFYGFNTKSLRSSLDKCGAMANAGLDPRDGVGGAYWALSKKITLEQRKFITDNTTVIEKSDEDISIIVGFKGNLASGENLRFIGK